MIYSFAHAVAIVHLLLGRTAGWVATGAVNPSTHSGKSLARSVARVGFW
jgi:cellulose synthase (UDP-forming)